jgi:hypothetical protein
MSNDFPSSTEKKSNEISGFRRGVGGVFAFLGCYVVNVGIVLPVFWDNLCTLEAGTDRLPRKWVNDYLYTLRKNTKERIPEGK